MPDIRLLTPEDAGPLRALRLEGLKEHPEAFYSTWEAESGLPPDEFERWPRRSFIFGAFVEGTLTGMMAYRIEDNPKLAHKGQVWGVYVRPQGRGHGLARALMTALMDHARARCEMLTLTVSVATPAARRLYERFGFETYGVEKKFFKIDGRYYDEIFMAKYF